jgi:geranylgeranyl pyrophosphate synthase
MVQKHIIHDAQTGKTTVVDYTAEEQAAYDDYNSTAKVTARKLEKVKQIRLEKLKATDWMSASDVTMPDYIKTWRQTLRDLPANHTNENAYNLLLARDSNGKLTHSVWTQPTE